jgi:hypothetical protein
VLVKVSTASAGVASGAPSGRHCRARVVGTKSGKPIGRARINSAKENAIRAALASGKGILKGARVRHGKQRRAAHQGRDGRRDGLRLASRFVILERLGKGAGYSHHPQGQ